MESVKGASQNWIKFIRILKCSNDVLEFLQRDDASARGTEFQEKMNISKKIFKG